ncbi:ankyrin repeat-containing protein At5g02620-like [Triticum dicoccoides]|uniref:ankyrin repeat-containing protein At5g02620-like n=1 Tax=Triticum dicoccoides TaxID=85692 RepID=UPI00188E114A|nr:ankyrin repeat-containing protein At5g02620-like [Triticum dicoccoides]
MAWNSTKTSESPTSSCPSGSPSPGDSFGSVDLPSSLSNGGSTADPLICTYPLCCGHCGKLEDLRRGRNTDSDSDLSDHRMTVPDASLAEQITFEGSSCFTCAKEIFLATDWIDGGKDRHDTPLHYAARSGNLRMLFHLICQLGDLYGHEWTVLVVRKLNVHGETALHEAVRLGTSSMCMVGMLMWVDPHLALHHAAHLPGSTSPLYLAVSLGHKDMAEMLHNKSGGNLSYSGPRGQNALHAAAHRPNGMIEMLLAWNKDLSEHKDKNDSTPLHYVVSEQSEASTNISIRDELEKHAILCVLDANPFAAYQHDKNGLLPVHVAALMDRKVAILILLERCGGCIALPDKKGRSFLHIAVRNKVYRIVKYSCQEEVFEPILNARDNDGNTALHLAVEVEDLHIFCYLLRNPKVLLNVRNNKDQTPLDLARNKTLTDFSYVLNPENAIYKTLRDVGARHGSFFQDHVQHLCIQNQLSNLKDEDNKSEEVDDLKKHKKKEGEENQSEEVDEFEKHTQKKDKKKKEAKRKKKEYEKKKDADRKKKEDEEKKDSDQLTDSTRTLGLGSVLITTMTFGATFTVPAAVKAGNSSNGGTARLFSTWHFNGFLAVNMFAFLFSLIATVGLMFSGMSMVKLQVRRNYFRLSVLSAWISLTYLTVAFGLGVRTVLAPVGAMVSNLILFLTSLPLIYLNLDFISEMGLTYRPLSVRRGHKFVCRLFIPHIVGRGLIQFWPYIYIFLWAAATKSVP